MAEQSHPVLPTRHRETALQNDNGRPTVSVVVPTYNRRLSAQQTVECLLRQSLPPHEIIVVDDGSTDGTAETLRQTFGGAIKVLSRKNGGPAAARNCGIREANGDFVAFTDSDCLPDETWLSELLKGFDSPRVAGVGGVVKRADADLVSEYVDAVGMLNPFIQNGEVDYLVTANACFRRDVLFEARLFDERFVKPGGEDTELSVRVRSLGYELKFNPDAVVLHHHRQTLPALLKTMSNYGQGCYILFELWPERKGNFSPLTRLMMSTVAVRNMFRRCAVYSRDYGFGKALLFTLLEHYGYTAQMWGYLKEERKRGRHTRAASYGYATARPRERAMSEPHEQKPEQVEGRAVSAKASG
jgi:glycosyltransferase involved in cell wall biosynthesis